MSEEFNQLYAPPENIFRKKDTEVWNWVEINKERGLKFLRTNSAWGVADSCFDILLGQDRVRRPFGLSVLIVRKLRRMAREMIAVQTNIRPRWGFKTLKKDNKVKSLADKFSRLFDNWWFNTFVDRIFKGVMQFAGGGGTGYMQLGVDNTFNGILGNTEICARALNHRQIIPFHPPPNGDLQKCYAVGIYNEMSLPEAHQKFYWATKIIQADRNNTSRANRFLSGISKPFRGVVNYFHEKKKTSSMDAGFPTCDIIEVYVIDSSINTSGQDVNMGFGDTSFVVKSFYTDEENEFPVPQLEGIYFNTIPSGRLVGDINNRHEELMPIPVEYCQYYPNRRKIIWCSGGIIYDGPADNLHGLVPVSQFTFDKVEGEFLGFPVIMDARPMANSANNILRAFEGSILRKADPDLAVDQSVPYNIVKMLENKSTVGRIIQYPVALLAKAVLPLVPHEYFDFSKEALVMIDKLFEWAEEVTGSKQISNVGKLRQLPANDTVEGILAATGDLPVDIARETEKSLLYLGQIWLGLLLQVYDTQRVMNILGLEETLDFIDFNPISLIPKDDSTDSRPRWMRAREFMKLFSFYASPNSLSERDSTTNQLKMFQGKKMGLPLSDKEMFEVMYPEKDYNESKKQFYLEQEEKSVAAVKVQAALRSAMQEAQGLPNLTLHEMIQGLASGSISPEDDIIKNLLGGNPQGAGRPSTDSKSPQLREKKDEVGIPRETLETS